MTTATPIQAQRLIGPLRELYDQACALENEQATQLAAVDATFQHSARNLLHYLAVRQHDIRPLQNELAALGLSSLGRLEAHTMATLQSVLIALHRLAEILPPDLNEIPPVTFFTGPMLLNQHSLHLLGEPAGKRTVRIMVTMPSEAATDGALLRSLLASGMDVMRINCAHDDVQAWTAMIRNLREAERALGRPCKIYADLAGPKLRTGAIEPLSHLVKFRPQRDALGRVVRPAYLWLTPEMAAPLPSTADLADAINVPLAAALFAQLEVADELRFVDARGRRRRLIVITKHATGCVATSDQTGYLVDGTALQLFRGKTAVASGCCGVLPPLVVPLVLAIGDQLLLTREDQPGRAAQRNAAGEIIAPAQIPITLEAVFAAAQPGEPIWFDDGKIGGQIVTNDGHSITVVQEKSEQYDLIHC